MGLDGATGPWRSVFQWGGSTVPWIEMAIGLLLWVPAVRRGAALAAVVGHPVIIVWFGPFGLGTNLIVVPWNLVMAGLLVVLIVHGASPRHAMLPRTAFRGPVGACLAAIAVLAGACPLLSEFGRWDRSLSFHLYSGREQRFQVVMSREAAEKLPPEWRPFFTEAPQPGFLQIDFTDWSLRELGVPAVTADRVLLACGQAFVARHGEAVEGERVFFYRDYPHLLEARGWETHPPDELVRLERFPPFRRRPPY